MKRTVWQDFHYMRHQQPKLRHDMYYAPRYIPVVQLEETTEPQEKRSLSSGWMVTAQLFFLSIMMMSVFSWSLLSPTV